MRSTVTLAAPLLDSLRREVGARSKTEAVVYAIKDFLRRRQASRIKLLKGKLRFDRTAEDMRHYER